MYNLLNIENKCCKKVKVIGILKKKKNTAHSA